MMPTAAPKPDTLAQRVREAKAGHMRLADMLRAYREKRQAYNDRFGSETSQRSNYRLRRGIRRDYRA